MGLTPLGIDDYRTNPARGGEPEAPLSWQVEVFQTWAYRCFAGLLTVGFVFGFLWRLDGKSMVTIGLSAVLFAGIAIARQRILKRKKLAFQTALQEYRDGLSRAFDDWK
jgi:O-antigen/teichoic acid export membrane protein